MRENGMKKLTKEMEEATKYGRMDLFMKVIGETIKLTGEVD